MSVAKPQGLRYHRTGIRSQWNKANAFPHQSIHGRPPLLKSMASADETRVTGFPSSLQAVPNKPVSVAQQNPSIDHQVPVGSSRMETKPVETQEQIAYFPAGQQAPRVQRPVATQGEEAGGPTKNCVYQQGSASGLMPTHQVCGFTPFSFPADPSLHLGRPPSAQQLPAQLLPRQINIGVNVPVKPVAAMIPSVTSTANPFVVIDVGHNANDSRDKAIDNDLLVTINDRKVRLSSAGSDSLYTLCRRWVRNDVPRKDQPILWDNVRPLPRPLSAAVVENHEEKSTGDSKEDEKEANMSSELEGPIENISDQELLQTHVKRAKVVRARLRDERKQRIERFKQRLALLLPPSMEQNKSESTVPS